MTAAAQPTVMAPAKSRPTLTATARELTTGRVKVRIASNAKRVKVRYTNSKGKKRTIVRRLAKGKASVKLPRGAHAIRVRTLATSRLYKSPWLAVTTSPQSSPTDTGWRYYTTFFNLLPGGGDYYTFARTKELGGTLLIDMPFLLSREGCLTATRDDAASPRFRWSFLDYQYRDGNVSEEYAPKLMVGVSTSRGAVWHYLLEPASEADAQSWLRRWIAADSQQQTGRPGLSWTC